MTTPEISIIIPTYNREKYIKKCLESVQNQTLQNIEIIVSDDASVDQTVAIVETEMKQDARIRLITSKQNQTAFVARKRGMELAQGKYIMFVDSDDEISAGLCEELLELQKKYSVDILQFSSEIKDCGVGEKIIRGTESFVRPYLGKLQGVEVFTKCFCERIYGFSLWNKIFSAQLCKQTVAGLPDAFIPKANDLILYYCLALNAKSYLGLETNHSYCYHYGTGDTGKKSHTKEQFQIYCHYGDSLKVLKKYAKQNGFTSQEVVTAWIKMQEHLSNEAVWIWKETVKEADKTKALKQVAESLPIEFFLSSLQKYMKESVADVARRMKEVYSWSKEREGIKTVAVYYSRMRYGGVERVISLLLPMYQKMGYRVILLTEEPAHEEDYEIPVDVKHYVISDTTRIASGRTPYFKRAQELMEIFQKEQIDAICYQAASSPILLYDLLLAKNMGLYFFVTKYEMFSQGMASNMDCLQNGMEVYPLADQFVVLSRIEELVWKKLQVDSRYIPNPYSETIEKQPETNSNTIVWIGRFDSVQKRYQDMIPIMQYVSKHCPDAVLKIYGSTYGGISETDILELIKENSLQQQIQYCGYETDVNAIYKDARLVLVTSAFETFPMNIFESKISGVPLVAYNMPYIELLHERKGCIIVEQENWEAAAEAVLRILTDDELYKKLRRENLESAEQFTNEMVYSAWEQLLSQPQKKETYVEDDYSTILRTIAFHHSLGCQRVEKQKELVKKLRYEKAISELSLRKLKDGVNIALYPFGAIGKKVKQELEQNGIRVDLIVDNKLANTSTEIKSVEDIAKGAYDNFVFVICSDRADIYEELRKPLKMCLREEQVYDLFPKEEWI